MTFVSRRKNLPGRSETLQPRAAFAAGADAFAAGASPEETGRWPAMPRPASIPVTGEGLFYALSSGDLLAQALIEGQPEIYPETSARGVLGRSGICGRTGAKAFRGTFLGAAITTRMVQC